MESEAAALAARRASPADLAGIKRSFHNLQHASGNGHDLNALSMAFSPIPIGGQPQSPPGPLCQMAGRPGLGDAAPQCLQNEQEVFEQLQSEHHKLIMAIGEGDDELARELARSHVMAAALRRGVKVGTLGRPFQSTIFCAG